MKTLLLKKLLATALTLLALLQAKQAIHFGSTSPKDIGFIVMPVDTDIYGRRYYHFEAWYMENGVRIPFTPIEVSSDGGFFTNGDSIYSPIPSASIKEVINGNLTITPFIVKASKKIPSPLPDTNNSIEGFFFPNSTGIKYANVSSGTTLTFSYNGFSTTTTLQ